MADLKISELNTTTSLNAGDLFTLVQGSETKAITKANLLTAALLATRAGASTENKVPQWSATTGDLKDGLELVTTVGATGSDVKIATEQGIREAIATQAVAPTMTAGAAAAAVALRFGATTGEGMEIKVIEEDITTDGSAAYDLTQDIPSGAVILCVQANLDTAIPATTAVKVGIGITDDEDKYGKTNGLTQNLKIDMIPDWAVLGSAEDVQVFAVDTSGDDAGTLDAAGTVRIRIAYLFANSLDNA